MALPPILLCRHGETAWNAERRIQGQVDTPLNPRGREQAARNGRMLRERLGPGAPGWDFLASPLTRTRDTMAAIRHALDLPPDDYPTDPRLKELCFGDWQGATLAEIAPEAVAEREADKWRYVPAGAGAESYAMLEERMAPVFAALDRPTIVVAHGGILRCFLHRWGGMAEADAAHRLIPQDEVLQYRDGVVNWL